MVMSMPRLLVACCCCVFVITFLLTFPLAAREPVRKEATIVACTLLVDAATGDALVKQGDGCDVRNSPASTFKVALSVMGYDAGILRDAHAPAWPYKEEYKAWRESWKQTTDPTYWLKESVVWYSQQLTQKLGMKRFQRVVDAFDYGNHDLSGDPGRHNGLTRAWLSSSLQISPAEQIAFLRKLLARKLPVSARAQEMTMEIMPTFPLADGWTVQGKTGTGEQRKADGALDDDRQFGWFIGWARKGDRLLVFARLIKDQTHIESPAGFRARDTLLADLPALLARESQ
jgi:beta-lactamase class D